MSLVDNSLVWNVEEEDVVARHVSRIRIQTNENLSVSNFAFFEIDILTYVELSVGIEMIGAYAFCGCSNLRECVIPFTVTSIGDSAFEFCRSLKKVGLPPTIRTIEAQTFHGCKSLADIDIPRSVDFIDVSAFRGCSSLVYIELPPTLRGLEEGAFADCISLSGILIPKNVTIGSCVFEECSALQSIEIHEETENVDSHDFEGCDVLSNLYIPRARTIFDNHDDVYDDFSDWGCTLLHSTFPDDGDLKHKLRTRFHGLPIHRLCYFQGHGPKKTSLHNLGASLLFGAEHYFPTLNKPDKLGMTPLHILALSQRPNVDLCAEILRLAPETMVGRKDQFGVTAVEYSIRNRAPGAGNIVFLFFHVLVGVQIGDAIGLKKWRDEIMKEVSVLKAADLSPNDRTVQVIKIHRIRQKMEMMERTSLLETILWKRRIDATELSLAKIWNCQEKAQEKVDQNENSAAMQLSRAARDWCRVHCSAQIIIPKVLSYIYDRDRSSD